MFVCKVPDLLCAVTHIILMCVACFTVCGGPVVCPFPTGVLTSCESVQPGRWGVWAQEPRR